MHIWKKLRKNPQLWQRYFVREKIIHAIREFFLKEKFHEVETPLLVPTVIPESYLEIFEVNLLNRNREKRKMFLTTSPEGSLKKLLAAGIGNCFEITKSFRNTEIDSKLHNPEFTILEWYRINATYKEVMKDCEKLILHVYNSLRARGLNNIHPGKHISYREGTVDLSPPWERISVSEALEKYAHISFDEITQKCAIAQNCDSSFSATQIATIAKKKGYNISTNESWEEIFNQIFLNEVEPHLGTHGVPTIIYDYPQPLAALAKLKASDYRFAERFEVYISGVELANCYTELTDWRQQKDRFLNELAMIKKKHKISVKPDWGFIEALKDGLPSCSGTALGVDRLVMLFTNSTSIAQTLYFPL